MLSSRRHGWEVTMLVISMRQREVVDAKVAVPGLPVPKRGLMRQRAVGTFK